MKTKYDLLRLQHAGRACGLIFNMRAIWIGVHSSFSNRRLCLNVVPCFTFWITSKGGVQP